MLIDDLLYASGQIGAPDYLKGLTRAVRFQVDNVANYVYEQRNNEDEGVKVDTLQSKIPNIAPLAPSTWFEFGGLAKRQNKPATNSYGIWLWITYDRHTDTFTEFIEWCGESDLPDETRWLVWAQCFCRLPTGLSFMHWAHCIAIAEDGRFLGTMARAATTPTAEKESTSPVEGFYNETLVALTAICFAHCKGTEIEEHQPSRQVRRAAERKGESTYSFHTINIHPATQVLHTEGHISENGLAKALHICRGHFAHYTAEKPLFGKYTGTFYRPMHLRGKVEQGVTVKDYRVHAE